MPLRLQRIFGWWQQVIQVPHHLLKPFYLLNQTLIVSNSSNAKATSGGQGFHRLMGRLSLAFYYCRRSGNARRWSLRSHEWPQGSARCVVAACLPKQWSLLCLPAQACRSLCLLACPSSPRSTSDLRIGYAAVASWSHIGDMHQRDRRLLHRIRRALRDLLSA